jgi:3-oxoacyl-[acyl-carrier-protein] synthase III
MHAKIMSSASILPETVMSNADLAPKLGVTKQILDDSCGFASRRYLKKGDTGARWAAAATKDALLAIGMDSADLQAIFYSTVTPDHQFPGNAAFTQNELGIAGQAIADIRACDGGFLHTLNAAAAFIEVGHFDFTLLGANDFFSTYIRYDEKGLGITEFFADGAAVWILGPSEDDSGILSLEVGNDPSKVRSFWAELPATFVKPRLDIEFINSGKWYFSFDADVMKSETLRLMPEISRKALAKANVSASDIKLFIPSTIKASWGLDVAGELGIDPAKVADTHGDRGYYGTAMIPTCMDTALRDGSVEKGDLVLAATVGSGVSFGAMVYRV